MLEVPQNLRPPGPESLAQPHLARLSFAVCASPSLGLFFYDGPLFWHQTTNHWRSVTRPGWGALVASDHTRSGGVAALRQRRNGVAPVKLPANFVSLSVDE